MMERPRLEIWNYEPIDLSKKKVVELQQRKMEKQRIECENYEPIDLTDRNKKTAEPSIDLNASTISLTEEEMSNIDAEFGLYLSSIFDPSALDVVEQCDPPAPNTVQLDQVRKNSTVPDEVERNPPALDDTVELVESMMNAARLIFLKAERDFHQLLYRTLSQKVEAQSENSSRLPISGFKIIALQNQANVYIDELKALADKTTYNHNIPAIMSSNEVSRAKYFSLDSFGYRIASVDENIRESLADHTTLDNNIQETIPPHEESRVKNISFDTSSDQIVFTDENRGKASAENTSFGDNNPTTKPLDEESRVKNVSFDTSADQIVSNDQNRCKTLADYTPAEILLDEESRVKNFFFDTFADQIASNDQNRCKTLADNTPVEILLHEEFRVKNFSFDTSRYKIVYPDESGRYRLPLVIISKSCITAAQLKNIKQSWEDATLFTKIGDREIYHSDKIPVWDATNPQATKPELLKNWESHKDETFRNAFALPLDRVCLFLYACRKNTCPCFRSALLSVHRHEKANEHAIFDTSRRKRQRNESDEEAKKIEIKIRKTSAQKNHYEQRDAEMLAPEVEGIFGS